MIHAYQKGYIKHAPGKVETMADDIKPTSVTHFAATKHKGLRNRVKKAEAPIVYNNRQVNWKDRLTKMRLRRDPDNIETMNKQSFEKGFMKAALSIGVTPLAAVNMLKKANIDPNVAADNMVGEGLQQGALGAGIGALGGGALGYFSGRNQDPKKDHSTRNAVLGGLGGAALGGLGGGYHGLEQGFQEGAVQPGIRELEAYKNGWPGKLRGAINPQSNTDIDSQIEQLKHMTFLKALLSGKK